MSGKCPQCEKINDEELRVCSCGWEFWDLADIEKNMTFTPPQEFKLNIPRIVLSAGVLLIGFLSLVFLFDLPGFFLQTEKSVSFAETEPASANPLAKETSSSSSQSARNNIRAVFGEVTEVASGDRMTISDQVEDISYQVKLAGIESPGLDEEFGRKARKNLEQMVLKKEVFVYLEDRGGRAKDVFIGKVLINEKDINLEQLKSGFVKRDQAGTNVLTKFDLLLYDEAQAKARTAKIGLWKNGTNEAEDTEPAANAETVSAEERNTESPKSGTVVSRNETKRKSPELTKKDQPKSLKSSPPNKKAGSTPPAGATALCGDGTYSFSKTRSGTCSYHGGVTRWLNVPKEAEQKRPSTEKKYIRGSRGGCYYINSSGNKTYVDRTMCG